MWLVCNNSFVSIVQDRVDDSYVWVRARRRKDLDNFMEGSKYTYVTLQTEDSDYEFRCKIPKKVLSKILASKAFDIDYDNFKNAIKDDFCLKDFANRVWMAGVMTLADGALDLLDVIRKRRESGLNTK